MLLSLLYSSRAKNKSLLYLRVIDKHIKESVRGSKHLLRNHLQVLSTVHDLYLGGLSELSSRYDWTVCHLLFWHWVFLFMHSWWSTAQPFWFTVIPQKRITELLKVRTDCNHAFEYRNLQRQCRKVESQERQTRTNEGHLTRRINNPISVQEKERSRAET